MTAYIFATRSTSRYLEALRGAPQKVLGMSSCNQREAFGGAGDERQRQQK